jgi:transposase
MFAMKTIHGIDEWDLVSRFFPARWEERAKELGAITRLRKIKSASELLRLLLIHIAGGCSLRDASTRAKHGGIVTISDVGLLKRLRASSQWFRWMSVELLSKRGVVLEPPSWLAKFNVRTVDASVVSEPGSTGTDWRLHYSMKLYSLQCDQFLITRQETGESFLNFDIHNNDLMIGDRAYGRLKGMNHVKNNAGHYIVRLKNKAFKMYDSNGNDFSILKSISNLSIGKVQDTQVYVGPKSNNGHRDKLRLCIIRKSDDEAEKAMKKALKDCSKKQRNIYQETIELHRYIILATSLPKKISAYKIAELYRMRWQVEIAFKRLKSIMGLGHLPKKDEASACAWLHGKIFVALLVQSIIDEGTFFSPWGYPM